MIRLANAPDHPDRWRLTDIGLATGWIIQRLQAGCIAPDQALAEIIERVEHRGRPASEVSDE